MARSRQTRPHAFGRPQHHLCGIRSRLYLSHICRVARAWKDPQSSFGLVILPIWDRSCKLNFNREAAGKGNKIKKLVPGRKVQQKKWKRGSKASRIQIWILSGVNWHIYPFRRLLSPSSCTALKLDDVMWNELTRFCFQGKGRWSFSACWKRTVSAEPWVPGQCSLVNHHDSVKGMYSPFMQEEDKTQKYWR